MTLDPVECGFEVVDEQGAEDEGQTQPQRVGKQHQRSFERVSLLRSQEQRRAEKCSYTGRPAHRKYYPECQGGEKAHVPHIHAAAAAFEYIEFEYPQIVQTEENHDQSGDDVDGGLVFAQETSCRTGQSAEGDKYSGEAGHEPQRARQRSFDVSLSAAGEVRYIYRQHRQETGRDEGYDPFKKRNQILHIYLFFLCRRQPAARQLLARRQVRAAR